MTPQQHTEPAPRTAAGRALLTKIVGELFTGDPYWTDICHRILAIEAEAATPMWDQLMKGAEIGYTYGALGRDFAQVLPEIRRLSEGTTDGE